MRDENLFYEMPWFRPDPDLTELCKLADTCLSKDYTDIHTPLREYPDAQGPFLMDGHCYYVRNDQNQAQHIWNVVFLSELSEDYRDMQLVDDLCYMFKDSGDGHYCRDYVFDHIFICNIWGKLPLHSDAMDRSCAFNLPLRGFDSELEWTDHDGNTEGSLQYQTATLINTGMNHRSNTNCGSRLMLSMTGFTHPFTHVVNNLNIPEKFL